MVRPSRRPLGASLPLLGPVKASGLASYAFRRSAARDFGLHATPAPFFTVSGRGCPPPPAGSAWRHDVTLAVPPPLSTCPLRSRGRQVRLELPSAELTASADIFSVMSHAPPTWHPAGPGRAWNAFRRRPPGWSEPLTRSLLSLPPGPTCAGFHQTRGASQAPLPELPLIIIRRWTIPHSRAPATGTFSAFAVAISYAANRYPHGSESGCGPCSASGRTHGRVWCPGNPVLFVHGFHQTVRAFWRHLGHGGRQVANRAGEPCTAPLAYRSHRHFASSDRPGFGRLAV